MNDVIVFKNRVHERCLGLAQSQFGSPLCLRQWTVACSGRELPTFWGQSDMWCLVDADTGPSCATSEKPAPYLLNIRLSS